MGRSPGQARMGFREVDLGQGWCEHSAPGSTGMSVSSQSDAPCRLASERRVVAPEIAAA
jgi:hypothetical protein